MTSTATPAGVQSFRQWASVRRPWGESTPRVLALLDEVAGPRTLDGRPAEVALRLREIQDHVIRYLGALGNATQPASDTMEDSFRFLGFVGAEGHNRYSEFVDILKAPKDGGGGNYENASPGGGGFKILNALKGSPVTPDQLRSIVGRALARHPNEKTRRTPLILAAIRSAGWGTTPKIVQTIRRAEDEVAHFAIYSREGQSTQRTWEQVNNVLKQIPWVSMGGPIADAVLQQTAGGIKTYIDRSIGAIVSSMRQILALPELQAEAALVRASTSSGGTRVARAAGSRPPLDPMVGLAGAALLAWWYMR